MKSSYTRAYTTARDVLFDAFITSDGEPTSFARECACDIMQDWSAGTTKVIFDDASEITFHDADFTVNGLSAAARAMGLIGGATKSPERAAASRGNGRLGGRPLKYIYEITVETAAGYSETFGRYTTRKSAMKDFSYHRNAWKRSGADNDPADVRILRSADDEHWEIIV